MTSVVVEAPKQAPGWGCHPLRQPIYDCMACFVVTFAVVDSLRLFDVTSELAGGYVYLSVDIYACNPVPLFENVMWDKSA